MAKTSAKTESGRVRAPEDIRGVQRRGSGGLKYVTQAGMDTYLDVHSRGVHECTRTGYMKGWYREGVRKKGGG